MRPPKDVATFSSQDQKRLHVRFTASLFRWSSLQRPLEKTFDVDILLLALASSMLPDVAVDWLAAGAVEGLQLRGPMAEHILANASRALFLGG